MKNLIIILLLLTGLCAGQSSEVGTWGGKSDAAEADSAGYADKSGNVIDGDYGDVSVSSGAWMVDNVDWNNVADPPVLDFELSNRSDGSHIYWNESDTAYHHGNFTYKAGQTMSVLADSGKLVMLSPDSSKWILASNTDSALCFGKLGISFGNDRVITWGTFTTTTLTQGRELYVGTNGTWTHTPPTGSGVIRRIICSGATSTTEFDFYPSNEWTKLE